MAGTTFKLKRNILRVRTCGKTIRKMLNRILGGGAPDKYEHLLKRTEAEAQTVSLLVHNVE